MRHKVKRRASHLTVRQHLQGSQAFNRSPHSHFALWKYCGRRGDSGRCGGKPIPRPTLLHRRGYGGDFGSRLTICDKQDYALFQNKTEVNILDVYNAIKNSKRIYPDSIVKELAVFREKYDDIAKSDGIILPIVTIEEVQDAYESY